MKFVISFVALALIAASDAAPVEEIKAVLAAPEVGTYSGAGSSFFEDNLDGVQGALEDIAVAGGVLKTIETRLSTLDTNSGDVIAVEAALETAIDTTKITNAWST